MKTNDSTPAPKFLFAINTREEATFCVQLQSTCLLILWNQLSCQPPHLEQKENCHQIVSLFCNIYWKRMIVDFGCSVFLVVLPSTFVSISLAGQSTFFSSCKSVEISLASSICKFLTLVGPPIEKPLLNFLITRPRILLQVTYTFEFKTRISMFIKR